MYNQYKRLSAKEHSDRVRFQANLVDNIAGNKYNLIFPRQASGSDPDLYLKFQKRADELWKSATGTFINEKLRKKLLEQNAEPEEKKKKKKRKKKPKVQAEQDPNATDG